MPGGFPISYGQANFNDQGSATSTSLGTVLTASGSTNTKGSYAQLIASTPYDAVGFWVQLAAGSQATGGYLIDIAVGAAASEVVIAPNISNCQSSAANTGAEALFVPVAIPAGSRIAARVQCATASATITCSVDLCDGSFAEMAPLGPPQNYGALTATSNGTSIDPGATPNTKGSWVQMTASSVYDIGALQLVLDTLKGSVAATQSWLIDIGVGAGGSEVAIISNLLTATNGGNNLFNATAYLFRTTIPAGSRIAMRAQGTNSTSGTRKFGASLLGYQL